jgi:hypothetical protein
VPFQVVQKLLPCLGLRQLFGRIEHPPQGHACRSSFADKPHAFEHKRPLAVALSTVGA